MGMYQGGETFSKTVCGRFDSCRSCIVYFYAYTNVTNAAAEGYLLRGRADNSDRPKHHWLHFYDYKEVMFMKENKQQDKSPNKKEHLSEKDIKELMGMNKQTYKRNRHGAVTNK